MSRVSYNANRLIPAPYVNISKDYVRTEDGTKLGTNYSINLIGTTLADKGSPMSGGLWWDQPNYPPDASGLSENDCLGILIKKQEAIRELFSEDRHLLEIQSENPGLPPMRCTPVINNISFSEGPWVRRFEYNIAMSAPELFFNGLPASEDGSGLYIKSASETWDIQTEDTYENESDRTYRVSHSISVSAFPRYDETGTLVNDAWKEARDFALPRLGFDSFVLSSSGVQDLPSYYSPFNFVRGENIDKLAGTYSVQENWILASGSSIESYEVSVTTSADNNLTQVTIQGNIQGLESRDSNMSIVTTKISNAQSKYDLVSDLTFTRAQNYAGIDLNIVPVTQTTGKNPIAGTINYNFEYNNRPSNFVSTAKSEVVTIEDNLPASVIAAIPVLGRTQGPVLQDMSMGTERTRTLNIELVMPTASGLDAFNSNPRTQGLIDDIINAATPTGTYQIFVVNNRENWSPKTGQYSHSRTWLYENN